MRQDVSYDEDVSKMIGMMNCGSDPPVEFYASARQSSLYERKPSKDSRTNKLLFLHCTTTAHWCIGRETNPSHCQNVAYYSYLLHKDDQSDQEISDGSINGCANSRSRSRIQRARAASDSPQTPYYTQAPDGPDEVVKQTHRRQIHSDDSSFQPNPSHTNYLTPAITFPKIDLPTFSGEASEWKRFHQLFKNTVDNNPGLPDIAKLSYLVASLTGQAAQCMAGFGICGKNYKPVLERLEQRFGSDSRIARDLYRSLAENRCLVVRIPKNTPSPIEIIHEVRAPSLIIGNDLFWTFVTRRLDRFVEGYQLINSVVEPLLAGFTPAIKSHTAALYTQVAVTVTDKEVNKQIHDWLELETIGVKEESCADEDEAAWNRFKETYKIIKEIYSVSLSIRHPEAEIPSNEGLTIRRYTEDGRVLINGVLEYQESPNDMWRSLIFKAVTKKLMKDMESKEHGPLAVIRRLSSKFRLGTKSTPETPNPTEEDSHVTIIRIKSIEPMHKLRLHCLYRYNKMNAIFSKDQQVISITLIIRLQLIYAFTSVVPITEEEELQVMAELDQFIIEKMGRPLGTMHENIPTKNIVELRKTTIKRYLKDHLFKRRVRCPLCDEMNGQIRNDGARCVLIDFTIHGIKEKKVNIYKTSNEIDGEEEIDENNDDSEGSDFAKLCGDYFLKLQSLYFIEIHYLFYVDKYSFIYHDSSVITPDPYLDIDEIGIPEIFAKKLTYTEPVNLYNTQQMKNLVRAGSKVYPGANFVISASNKKMILGDLNNDERKKRYALANTLQPANTDMLRPPMKVLRHLKKGDMMMMNRQPSLHKPSIQGHRVRVITGQRALRMNYAPCKAYNADFDGDEMNGHLVQSHIAQCEVAEIANVGSNFLVPKDATPLLGLIQDHVVSGVLLTMRGRFLTKEDFMHLVLAAFAEQSHRIVIPPPAMIKPCMLWSGKQVISCIIHNCVPTEKPLINLTSKAKTPLTCWKVRGFRTPDFCMSESEVVFRQGELLVGVLDKQHYGATQYGLGHCCFELYGHKIGIKILSCFSRLFTTYLQFHGFTLGVADILVRDDANKERRKAIKESRVIGEQVVRTAFGLDENAAPDDIKKVLASTYCNPRGQGQDVKMLDFSMKQAISKYNDAITKSCVPEGLIRSFPENALQMMIQSGAKGSAVNAIQISCCLGQIELEGKRMAVTVAGRTLPSFKAFDPSPRAGGYVDQRFLTGINPQELFFHTMAGREGLIDTAVKTSRSGYLQRCIIKHLEGIKVHYDATVRDHDGSIIQFRYGEDGLDVMKSTFINPKTFPFIEDNLEAVTLGSKPENVLDSEFNIYDAIKQYKKIQKWRRRAKKRGYLKKQYMSGFTEFSADHLGCEKNRIVGLWNELDHDEKRIYEKRAPSKCPDAVDEVIIIIYSYYIIILNLLFYPHYDYTGIFLLIIIY
uniref:DNA-directed RNA polymerase n=1 Tax=Heterorhabditis bacteriophora TaxID=37862 RepID=A0A1I7XEJ0_HETBA